MSRFKETVSFDKALAKLETEKALLVACPEWGDEEIWWPKSQIHEDSEVYKAGDEGTLIVSQWIADQKMLG